MTYSESKSTWYEEIFTHSLKALFSHIKKSASSLIFPAFCMHCASALSDNETTLCIGCTQALELLDPKRRCSSCFCRTQTRHKARCSACRKKKEKPRCLAGCFDLLSPMKSVIHAFQSGQSPFFARGLAAYALVQLDQLQWPAVECVTYVPQAALQRMLTGYDPARLIAEELAGALKCPIQCLLTKEYMGICKARYVPTQKVQNASPKSCLLLSCTGGEAPDSAAACLQKHISSVYTLVLMP